MRFKFLLYPIILLLFIHYDSTSQNVGVDVASPQQKLDVAGALKIGSTTTGVAGSLRWTGSEFQFHNGSQWITLNTNTDDQVLNIIQLSGNTLEISLENDGIATHAIDLSQFMDNTDDQTLDVAQLTGSDLELSLEDDGQATQIVDLSSLLDNTDDQQFDVVNITSDELRLSLESDAQATHTLDLSPYKDNTDDQTLDVVQLTGNMLELSLEDDSQPTHSIDLSGFADNTDEQQIDVLSVAGNTMNISLSGDGVPNETLDLSQFMDNTDDQQLNDFSVAGNILTLDIENAGGIQSVNLASYLDNTDNQEITQFNLIGNTLQLTLEDDAGGQETVDLSGYLDNTDNQEVTTFSLSGTDLELQVEDDAGGLQTVDLDPLRRLLTDDDGDTKVEVEATADEDQIRFATDGGEAMRINTTQQVGIGLSSGIQHKLVVNGTASDTRSVLGLRGGNAQNAFSDGAQIAFGYDGDDAYQHFIHTRHNSAGGSTNNAIDFYVTDGTQYNTVSSGSTHVMSLNSGNVGVRTTSPEKELHVIGNIRASGLAGSNTRNLLVDANGDLIPGSSDIPDITSVTAGDGLTGTTASGDVTLDVVATNGLTASADEIQLGGTLIQNTTIAQGGNDMTFNLNGTGDFNLEDDGTTKFQLADDGTSYFGGDVYLRDGSTTGTDLVSVTDDGNDGELTVYENGTAQILLDANGTSVFNEQGGNRDFRIESDNLANMFRVDASTDRIGINTASPGEQVSIGGNNDQGQLFMDNGDEFHIRNDQQNNEILISDGGGGIRFEYNDSETMRVVANVGIGTGSPQQKLHVNGNARFTAVSGSGVRNLSVDANGDLTTAQPTTGDAGFWNRSGSVLSPSNAGDKVDMNGENIEDFQNLLGTNDATFPHLVLNSTSSGNNWSSQGAYISLGESGNLGGASLHLTYRGDGYGFIGSGAVANGEPGASYMRFDYNSNNIYTPDNLDVNAQIRFNSANADGNIDMDNNEIVEINDLEFENGAFLEIDNDQNIQLDDANPTWNGQSYGGVTRFYGDASLNRSKLEAGGLQLERTIQIKGGGPAAGRVLVSDANGFGSWQDISSAGIGDNLGNHTATTTLNMTNHNINNVNRIEMNDGYIEGNGSGVTIAGDANDISGWFYDNTVYLGDGNDNLHLRGHITETDYLTWSSNRGIDGDPGGNYGSLETRGSGKGNWEGYSINSRFVLMSDNNSHVGLYDDIENDWIIYWDRDASLRFYEPDGGGEYIQLQNGANLNMRDNHIYDVNNIQVNNLYDGDGGSQIEVYDDMEFNDRDVWDVNRLTVNTIYSEDDYPGVGPGNARVDVLDRLRVDLPGGQDFYVDNDDGRTTLRTQSRNHGQVGRFQNYWYRTVKRYDYRLAEGGFSDRRVKKNIRDVDGESALDQVMQLNGKKFDLAQNHPFMQGVKLESNMDHATAKDNLGFIAQELREVVPEMVVEDEETGYLVVVDYEQLFPIIIEAMQEQQEEIAELRQMVTEQSGGKR